MVHRLLLLLATALGLFSLSGCHDNISCVFTTGCRAGNPGFLGASAALPVHGSWIIDGDPTVDTVFPFGTNVAPSAPVVVVFSESMDPATLTGAFELVPLFGQIPGPPVADVGLALFGDGRLLGMFPALDLPPGVYSVRVSLGLVDLPRDLTGRPLMASAGQQVSGLFTVGNAPTPTPALVTAWPPDGMDEASDITEIVLVFDRPMDATTVDADSVQVEVEGVAPMNDPSPLPLERAGPMNTVLTDTRVFVYRSADPFGTPTSLGADVGVQVILSPVGHAIRDATGVPFALMSGSFNTLPVQAPLVASILSQPTDAIGLANLTPGNPEELAIQVDLADGQPGQTLDLFLFGTDPASATQELAALQRSFDLTGTAPILAVHLTRAQIDLQTSNDPHSTRYADGPVAMGFRVRRGTLTTAVRVLDVQSGVAGIQDALLDTVEPVIDALFPDGSGTASSISDLRDVVLAGQASELLRSVEVSTGVGTNGVLPNALSREDGRFLTTPVRAGVLASGSTPFMAVGYDLALNPSAPITGIHEQRGAVLPGGFAPGDAVEVEVFDQRTLAPLPGAMVYLHADMGDGVNFPLASSGVTGIDGRLPMPLASAGAPAVGALVTVERPGYDLFTFFDLTSTAISIPLEASATGSAEAEGEVTTSDPDLGATLTMLDGRVDDTRRPAELVRAVATDPCTTMMGITSCPFGSFSVAPGHVGVTSFLAGDFGQSEALFAPELLVRAFGFVGPVGPTDPGDTEATTFEPPFLLDDPAASTGSAASELAPVTLRGDLTSGIDLLSLLDDPTTTGAPFVGAETLVGGVAGPLAVGLGLAFDQGGGMWAVRTVVPGSVTVGGELGGSGLIDPDLFLRCELRDSSGAVAGIRPRLSDLPGSGVLSATDVPVLVSPASGGNTGGQGITVLFSNAIPDAAGEPGLYRVDLVDTPGRRWSVWRTDPSGTADVLVHAPDLTASGGTGLADGALTCRIHAFAWPGFDAQAFLWTDPEREHELVSRSRTVSFQKP